MRLLDDVLQTRCSKRRRTEGQITSPGIRARASRNDEDEGDREGTHAVMARSSSLDVAASSRLMIVVRLTADMAVVVRCLGCWRGGQEDWGEGSRAGGQGRPAVASGSTPTSSTLARRRYALLLFSEPILPTYSGRQFGRTRSPLSARLVLIAQDHCLCPPSCRSPAQQPLSVSRDRSSERQGSWTDLIFDPFC